MERGAVYLALPEWRASDAGIHHLRRRPKAAGAGERRLLGVPFLTLSMGQPPRPHGPLARRRALLAARQMRERGVRSAVFPVDFPYTALFLGQGICPVDTLPLRRALAAPLTRRKLESMGLGPTQAVVAVSAQRLIREAEDAVRSLALSFRYVLLSAGSGGEVLARELRREYGISLLLDPARDQLDRADALLLYAPRPDLAGDNAVLWGLYPGGELGRAACPWSCPPPWRNRWSPLRPGAADSGPVRPGRPASGGRSHGNS